MEHEEFVSTFIDRMRSYPGFRSNHTHIWFHCPNCEEHREVLKHGHCYVNVTKENLPGSCKKCDFAMGAMSPGFLKRLGIVDSELIHFSDTNFKTRHTHVVSMDEKNKKLSYIVPNRTNNNNKFKIRYLSDRVGKDLDNEEDLKQFKVITSLSSFLKLNKIDPNSIDQFHRNKIQMIDDCYIGLLSLYGNCISFRYVGDEVPEGMKRYELIIVSNEIKRPFTYIPSVPFDPLAKDPKIVVAEGGIDIISIICNSINDLNDTIYISANSVGAIRRAVLTVLMFSGYYGGTINIYIDNDGITPTSPKDTHLRNSITKMARLFRDFGESFRVNVLANLTYKDMGDRRKPIKIFKKNINGEIARSQRN